MTQQVIDLSRLRPPLPFVDLGEDGVHAVKWITGVGMELLRDAKNPESAIKLWEAAMLCVPTATREQVLKLCSEEVEMIIAIAMGQSVGGGS